MGTVHALAAHGSATITEASDANLVTLVGPESAGTRLVYSGVLRALAEVLGADTDVATLQPRAVAAWFTFRSGTGETGAEVLLPARLGSCTGLYVAVRGIGGGGAGAHVHMADSVAGTSIF